MISRTPSHEFLLNVFRTSSGLYLLGAGASAGLAPLGRAFWTAAPLDFLRKLTGFSPSIPAHSELTRAILRNSGDISLSEIFPDREIRPGTADFQYIDILQRIPSNYSRLLLKHLLSTANFSDAPPDSYCIFQLFGPS